MRKTIPKAIIEPGGRIGGRCEEDAEGNKGMLVYAKEKAVIWDVARMTRRREK
jgi:hypothetical protein